MNNPLWWKNRKTPLKLYSEEFFFENDTILYYYTASMYLNFEVRIFSLLLFTQIIVIMSIFSSIIERYSLK